MEYFVKWNDSINGRSGNFSKRDREKMFISTQTYEGIHVTTLSMIELIRVNFILTEKFNQDFLEQNFGTHRSLGGRSDNPTLEKFGYDENTIRMQRSVVPVTGNTKGGFKGKRRPSWSVVDETPLKKRCKKATKTFIEP